MLRRRVLGWARNEHTTHHSDAEKNAVGVAGAAGADAAGADAIAVTSAGAGATASTSAGAITNAGCAGCAGSDRRAARFGAETGDDVAADVTNGRNRAAPAGKNTAPIGDSAATADDRGGRGGRDGRRGRGGG